ncbi:hypothetical protein PYCC9005_005920 [Savitreella phatthalungensis]
MSVITVDNSDGVDRHWVKTEDRVPPTTGSYDYFRSVKDDEPKMVRWLSQLGNAAKDLLPDARSLQTDVRLAALPKGYQLVEHCKSMDGTSQVRRDAYLFGHPDGGRYRSINEFTPHLRWLVGGRKGECECRLDNANQGKGAIGRTPRPSAAASVKPERSAMSELGRAKLKRAKLDRAVEMHPFAHAYRLGEIVLGKNDKPYIIEEVHWPHDDKEDDGEDEVTQSQENDTLIVKPTSTEQALAMQSYMARPLTAGAIAPDLERHQSAYFRPYLSTDAPPLLLEYGSGIARFTVDERNPPGPFFLGWFLGPEKLWTGDVVRLDEEEQCPREVLVIEYIIWDRDGETKPLKVRGDILELVSRQPVAADTNGPNAGLPLINPSDNRVIPEVVQAVAAKHNRIARYTNPKDCLYELTLGEVKGRLYHPLVYSGPLQTVAAFKIARGRRDTFVKLAEWAEGYNAGGWDIDEERDSTHLLSSIEGKTLGFKHANNSPTPQPTATEHADSPTNGTKKRRLDSAVTAPATPNIQV